MYRFFVEKTQIEEGFVRITGDDAHHLRDVLRARIGEKILVACEDEWEYTCEVETILPEEVRATIVDAQRPAKELPSRITLFQCLPKGDKMETVIQKAVELGAYAIVPVASARCVVKLDAKKAEAKVRRWNAIAESAAKQAKRLIIPEVWDVMPFTEALSFAQGLSRADDASGETESPALILPYENAEGMAHTREQLESIQPGRPVGILIGPEGGFSEEEVTLAEEAGFAPVTLGKRILRTETAGMMILSVLSYLMEP